MNSPANIPITDAEYRSHVLTQHEEILATQRTMTATLAALTEAMRSGNGQTERALNGMRDALMSALKVPVAAVMVSAVSVLFYTAKIQESTWIIFCLVSMFPWFGDSIRTVLQIIRGNATSSERIVSGMKLVALSTAALSLYFTHQ